MLNLPAWITVKEAPTFPKWKLVDFQYISPENPINNQGVNIYIRTQDWDGKYKAGVRVYQEFPTDTASALTRREGDLDFNAVPYGVAFEMSGDSSFSPDRGEHGPYTCYAQDNSDRVSGLGLPLRRHIQYLLTLRWTEEPTPDPTPVPPPVVQKWSIRSQTETQIVLERVLS